MSFGFYNHLFSFILLICCTLGFIQSLDYKNIIYTIVSQDNSRHEQKALKLKISISKQTNFSSVVYLTHIDKKHVGDWTILPVLPFIWKKHKQKFSWAFFCTDDTMVDTSSLIDLLKTLQPNITFVGRGLNDKDPTIIHHFFSSLDFKYPLVSSGFALHHDLIQKLVDIIENNKFQNSIDFSIDASHELAMFIKNNVNGSGLTHSPQFCISYKKNCATHIKNNFICDQQKADLQKIYFAVKTCKKFHKDRVPVILKTWGQRLVHLTFYSDAYDKSIPTVQLNVPNTEHGHCGKTQAIIADIIEKMNFNKDLEWAVISDDDTLFSLLAFYYSSYRLQELLGCYKSTAAVALGERYGYNVLFNNGYNYLTGGSGVVLSREAIKKFRDMSCKCPSDSTPDDMFLFGICFNQLNISIIHIPLFHQARPNDYNEEYLLVGPPISFHKHWMIDPIQVYHEWFQLADVLHEEKKLRVEL